MKGNRKLVVVLLPLAVVVPMLVVSAIIGPQSIWVWAGVGLGMAAVWWMNRKPQPKVEESKGELHHEAE